MYSSKHRFCKNFSTNITFKIFLLNSVQVLHVLIEFTHPETFFDKSSKHRFFEKLSTNITFKFISLQYLIGLKMYD